MGNLLGDAVDITSRSPLKTRRLDDASIVTDVSAETVTFQYDNSGSLASATGQAAGTMIYAKLTYDGVLNSFKDKVGDMKDSSFAFVTGTVLTTALGVDIEREVDNWRRMTVTEKFAEMAKHMQTNGQYWVDHADGAVWGIAADVVADDTANYSYKAPVQATGPSVATSVKVTDGINTAAVLARTTGTEQPAATDDVLVVYDVGGGAATASAEYQATSNGRDGTVVYASASTLTLTGTPVTVNSEDLVYIREVDATGNTAALFVNGAGGVHLEISGSTITKSGGSDFSANGVYELGYNAQKKAYSAPSNSDQATIINPVWEQFIGDTPAALTDIATNTTGYLYLDMAGYRYFALQGETSGTTPTDVLTVTIEATCQDDGTAASSCTYQDVTQSLFRVASWVDTDFFAIADTPVAFKYVRLKYVTSNDSGNDADLTVYAKRMY